MRTHSRSAFGLAMVTALMLVTACSDGGGSPVDPPPPPPPAKTKEIGVWTENKQPVPDGTTVTIIDRNGSRSAPVVGDKATFILDPDLVADGDSVSIYVSGNDQYYPSYGKVQITILRYYDVGAVLVPAKRCLVKDNVGEYNGDYNGACSNVSLPACYEKPSLYVSYCPTLPVGLKLPIKVALDPNAVGDSVQIWKMLHLAEEGYGTKMYVPAPFDEVVDSVYKNGQGFYTVHGLYVRMGPQDVGYWGTDDKGMFNGGTLMYQSSSLSDLSIAMTYVWMTLGPHATCSWPSVVPCKSYTNRGTLGATMKDVVYTRLMHSVGNAQYNHGAQLGLYAGLRGYDYAKEHNLPHPSIN